MKGFKFLRYVFLVLGLVLLVVSVLLYNNTRSFLAEAVSADGVVIELERSRSSDSTTYHPIVEFHTKSGERIEFRSSSGSNPPSYTRGEKVTVWYLEDRPEKAKIEGFFSLWGGAVIVGGIGFLQFLAGFILMRNVVAKKKKKQYLKDYGVPIKARFQRVESNRSNKGNDRSPFKIIAQWTNPTTSKLHIFKSENLWFDPTDHINVEEVTVLIDKNNPKTYLMDTSFLPELAE